MKRVKTPVNPFLSPSAKSSGSSSHLAYWPAAFHDAVRCGEALAADIAYAEYVGDEPGTRIDDCEVL